MLRGLRFETRITLNLAHDQSGSVFTASPASSRWSPSNLWRCWRGRLLYAVVLASVLNGLPRGSGALGAEWSRYRPAQLREVAEDVPGQRGVSISGDVPVQSRVVFAGELRDLANDSRRLIAAWGDAMGVPGMLEVFRREVRVRQEHREYWLPVQEPLVRPMEGELRAGELIEVFVIYIGRVDGRAVFLVNAFDHSGAHRDR